MQDVKVRMLVFIFKLLLWRSEGESGNSIVRSLGTPSLTRAAPSLHINILWIPWTKGSPTNKFWKKLHVTHLTQTLQRYLILEYNLVFDVLTFPSLCPICLTSSHPLPYSLLPQFCLWALGGSLTLFRWLPSLPRVASWVTLLVRPCLPHPTLTPRHSLIPLHCFSCA